MLRAFWPRLIAGALAVATLITAAYTLLKPLVHAESGVYEMPTDALVGVFSASCVASIGLGLIFLRYRNRVALLSVVATFLLLFGILTMASVGLLVLPLGLFAFALMAIMTAKYDARTAGWSATSGSLLSLGLVVTLIAFIQPPIVRCLPGGGVASSSHYWWGGGPSSGSASGSSTIGHGQSSSDLTQVSGTITMNGETITYACRDGKLVEFTRTSS